MTLFWKKQKKKAFAWFIFPIFACVILLGTCLFTAPVFAAPDDTGSETETVGDIYDVSTALTAYVNNVVGANGNDKHNEQRVENPGNVGNAGAYVGYGDENQGFVSFITSNTTIGSSSSTYDAWKEVLEGGDGNAVYGYVRFGKALADAGFDETMAADTTFNPARIAIGVISLIVFVAGEIVPTIFGFALSILKMFNVFALFGQSTVWVSQYWKDAFPTAPNFLDPLVTKFSHWYDILVNQVAIMAVIPILFAVVAVNVLLLRQHAGSQFAKLLKRLVFIVIGVPLMAGLYTAALDQLGEAVNMNTASARMVAATFVDFEAWADDGLEVPSGMVISSLKPEDGSVGAGGHLSTSSSYKLRNSALTLNQKHNDVLKTAGWQALDNSDHALVSGGLWNTDGQINVGDGAGGRLTKDGYFDESGHFVLAKSTQKGLEVKWELFNVLNRYMMSEQYTSGAYATKIAGILRDKADRNIIEMGFSSEADADNTNTVRKMFNDTDEVDDWMRREKEDNQKIWNLNGGNAEMKWAGNGEMNIFRGGNLTGGSDSGADVLNYSGKLSPMSMYNYLSTSFKESSIVTYSNATSVSEHVKQSHMSVTSIGNGFLGFLFLLNMWVCIGIVALVGCYFALSMTFKNLKTSFHLLTSIPLAVAGILKSIAQSLVYFFMMVAQLFIGAFMYTVVSEILMVVATIVERLAADGMDAVAGGGTVSIVPSSLAAIGVPEISVSEASLGAILVLEILAALVVGMLVWKYRRACVRGYDYSLTWCMRMVTLPEFMDVFETVWVRKERMNPVGDVVHGFGEVFAYLHTSVNYQYRKEVC